MESPGRHGDANDVAVTSPSKCLEERFEKLEKMARTINSQCVIRVFTTTTGKTKTQSISKAPKKEKASK